MVLSASPTPKQFASAWHKGLKKAVLEVSSPTRITKAQAERIGEDDPYYQQIRHEWSESLRKAYRDLPTPPWMA